MENVDVLIPLRAGGSKLDNSELRMALRSIEQNLSGYRNIIIVSSKRPDGFDNYRFVKCADSYTYKQKNIHTALKTVMSLPDVTEDVLFWADDNILLQPMKVSDIPRVHRPQNMMHFPNRPTDRWWYRSLRNTAEALKAHGKPWTNYEAHTPILFNCKKYLELEKTYDFMAEAGMCYISLYLNHYGVPSSVPIEQIKKTFERPGATVESFGDAKFIGYNDGGALGGLIRALTRVFPTASKYESVKQMKPDYSGKVRVGVVLGTYGAPETVELNLHTITKVNKLPVLVVDDCSGDPKLPEICAKYGAEFRSTTQPHGHSAGDLHIFAEGLEWAAKNGIDLLVKISKRFIANVAWEDGLLKLARESEAITFTSYSHSYKHLMFRTECIGMYVDAWLPTVEAIRKVAVPVLDVPGQVKRPRQIYVEGFMHKIAEDLAIQWGSPKFMQYARNLKAPRGATGYAIWSDMLGYDRKAPRKNFLWHNANTPEDYAEFAKSIGLDYTADNFECQYGRYELEDLLAACNTDKNTKHSYGRTYGELFISRKNDPVRILEIGIYKGGSLRAWQHYFQRGTIVGIDINPHAVELVKNIPRVLGFLCDINDTKKLNRFLGTAKFDIVIDDGSHKLADQILAAELFVPRLLPGGVMVIEDIQSPADVECFRKWNPEIVDNSKKTGRWDDILVVIKNNKGSVK